MAKWHPESSCSIGLLSSILSRRWCHHAKYGIFASGYLSNQANESVGNSENNQTSPHNVNISKVSPIFKRHILSLNLMSVAHIFHPSPSNDWENLSLDDREAVRIDPRPVAERESWDMHNVHELLLKPLRRKACFRWPLAAISSTSISQLVHKMLGDLSLIVLQRSHVPSVDIAVHPRGRS